LYTQSFKALPAALFGLVTTLFSLIRQVRVLDAETGGQIPAADLTAYASDQDRQRAIEAGFQTHLAKPVDPTQLIQMVANLMGR
jgi:two-component system CheB/CheR fusion protein